MKCPKCGGRLYVDKGGYIRSNISDGDVLPIAQHESCFMCGYYKELFPEESKNTTILQEFKNQNPKTEPAIGSLAEYVNRNYKRITKMRDANKTWMSIRAALGCPFNHSALGNSYRAETLRRSK